MGYFTVICKFCKHEHRQISKQVCPVCKTDRRTVGSEIEYTCDCGHRQFPSLYCRQCNKDIPLAEINKQLDSVNNGTGSCYIATACYGDYEATEVKVFRKFRDTKLLTTFSGKLFVKTYYRFSPKIAEKLKGYTTLNLIVKNFVLNPLYKILRKKYEG